ncbi:hypothetical protein [Lacrimispora sp.]|nr:hypothetical protein [Lacrimispora sp.]
MGVEEALDYFTEKFNADRPDLNNFEQACYMQVLDILEIEMMRERKIER